MTRGRPSKQGDTATVQGRVNKTKRDLLRALDFTDAMVYEKGAEEILQATLNSKGGLKSEILLMMHKGLTAQKAQIDLKLDAINKVLEGMSKEEAEQEKKLIKFRKAFSKVMGDNGNIDYYYRKSQNDHYGDFFRVFEEKARDISKIAKMPVTAEMVIKEVGVRWREHHSENEEGQEHGSIKAPNHRGSGKVDI